ncbi:MULTISPECIES: hypothetical protein [Nocardiaceae]|uniref:hypothetical protein n=1 Tax=Nocardiaceae TaxID=85025 RepID=UPI000A47AC00|nr:MULTISPECIES: hypothetical protein [Rhodococcus]
MTSPETAIAQWSVLIAKAAALGVLPHSDELDTDQTEPASELDTHPTAMTRIHERTSP